MVLLDGAACPSGCPPPPPANDLCADAFGPLPVPSTTAGTTERATEDVDVPQSCGTTITAPGVWYTVIGTGNTMTVTTCGDFFEFDTKISVYCADCADLTCIDGNDDDCAGGASIRLSTVTWCSQAGAAYSILVHAFSSASGDFEISVFDDALPCTPQIACPTSGTIPAVSQWGMIVMALLLLTAASIVLSRRCRRRVGFQEC